MSGKSKNTPRAAIKLNNYSHQVLQSLSVIPVLLAQPDYAAFEFDSMEEENTSPGDSPKTPGL